VQGSQIVARIKSVAAAKGVPLETLYAACKVSSSAVSQWKSGTTNPSMASIQRIADYLDVSPSFLLYGPESNSGLRLPSAPEPLPRSGLTLGGTKKPASQQADGIIDKIIALDPDMRELFVRILAAAKEDPERVKRYLEFLAQELESQR
jgi:transcriptional regulator with XRE-family HTH domain